ncbi:hypothetical protein QVD17_12760 [Tagetes erecta]|uniref:Uncharacterized protein n=1 Tax=Tagetes erecta TaxID=13708 RepID=A0AAD8KX10_TARER|nr:hypothetical protein QVD17_12760 [Tagetes erecta]
MGGKGKKRREKNYKEAHGIGKNRLPPPPLRSSLVDVIPSKLRTLISYTSSADAQLNHNHNITSSAAAAAKRLTKEKPDPVSSNSKIEEDTHEIDNLAVEKKKKKRKRKQVDDLRFVAELGALGSKRKERKKKRLEERKKKHKKAKKEDDLNFPGREEVKFGEVVQAPPKLVNVPKRFGSSVNASQERIRLRAIEAYRDQKKWASRPGLHLPTTDLTYHNSSVLPAEKQP